jgi:tetratricopeptide (TPR) repeat protein
MRLLALALTITAATAAPLPAQVLGTIDFPNSGKPEAQDPFIRGVLLLHSFEYEDAAKAFQEAQSVDPDFALAYWGEAMTYTHPLWNQQDLEAGKEALEKLAPSAAARRAKAGTDRERGFLATAEALYFAIGSKARRDTLCAAAFERLMNANPADDEPKAFYALWLMGLSQGVRNVPTYMHAGALAEEVYRHNPRHPGALHYIIHAFDDPIHAPLGLYAAREYSTIAPDAAHAQHMTTHIFLALGMWKETVRQNAIAAGPDSITWKPGHYTAWLVYALQQQGKFEAAWKLLDRMRQNLASAPAAARASYMLSMRGHYMMDTERWTGPVGSWVLDTAGVSAGPRAIDAYTVGTTQLQLGHPDRASGRLTVLEHLAVVGQDSVYEGNNSVAAILATQLRARLLWTVGNRDSALVLLRQAAEREDALPAEFGPPVVVKPTHELLGEFLLAAGRPADAQLEFSRALALAPGRSRSLLGLARAARAASDMPAAAKAVDQLERNWSGADPALPMLTELTQLRVAR